MFRYAFAVGLTALTGYGIVPAQQAPCGGATSEEQTTRRRTAIGLARQINTAEAKIFVSAKKYMPLASLTGVTVSEGFEVQVSTDGETYAFSVKDSKDECRPAAFSDQTGLIYTGMPLR